MGGLAKKTRSDNARVLVHCRQLSPAIVPWLCVKRCSSTPLGAERAHQITITFPGSTYTAVGRGKASCVASATQKSALELIGGLLRDRYLKCTFPFRVLCADTIRIDVRYTHVQVCAFPTTDKALVLQMFQNQGIPFVKTKRYFKCLVKTPSLFEMSAFKQ